MPRAIPSDEVASLSWNLLREDISLPSAILYRDRLLNNQQWMRRFISSYGVKIAPHGKTTMAPQLFRMQMEDGAWGITLATAHQTRVAYDHGVRRVLMANQLIGRQNMAVIAQLLSDPSFTFYCLVDSGEGVDALGACFAPLNRPIQVLIELGVMGGRAGVRSDAQLRSVLAAIDRWNQVVRLSGVEVYEGVLENQAEIRAFLRRACEVTSHLMAERRFVQVPPILTGAGSAWFDVVAEEFTSAGFGDSVQIVLRPGCYLTHDVGVYRKAHARMRQSNPVAREIGEELLPALHIWAYVQSIPEPERAIVGMGRRDVAFDSGLPVPALHFRPGYPAPRLAPSSWETTRLMDQHACLRLQPGDDLRVGDMIAFDICHPCLTFDKWRAIPVVDSTFSVVDIVQTFF